MLGKKYPPGLFYLFVTEMWERFSFYGISAVLILYLTKSVGLSDKEAGLASGAYKAFTFMTPILGGLVADKVLGLRKSVMTGGVLILVGNLVLAIVGGLEGVFSGLACIALGTGYLKSTVSVMVGKLYQPGDTHRDSGYTLFYMGINVGALLAGLSMGKVAEVYGWTKGFYLSSGGMLLGLVAFWMGRKHYNNEADGFRPEKFLKYLPWIIGGTVVLGAIMYYLFQHSGQTKTVITYLSIGVILGLLALAFSCKEKAERNSILAIIIIIVSAISYQAFGKQMYDSMVLFVERDSDKKLFGLELASSFFSLVPNAVAVILFAGVFTWMWARLADRGKNPSIPSKIVIALCFAFVSSAMLAWMSHRIMTSGERISAWWVVLAITVLTLGELNILPMGLSAASALAPKRYASLLMGSWFLTSSLGGYFAGYLTSLADVDKARVNDVAFTGSVYFGLYWKCAVGLAVMALVMAVITPGIKKLMASK